jgi:hypothetical protein
MIKKYKQFNEASQIPTAEFPPFEELEDHFLRLKEVFGCYIEFETYNKKGNFISGCSAGLCRTRMRYPGSVSEISAVVYVPNEEHKKFPKDGDIRVNKIIDELNQIKNRIESMYPKIIVRLVNIGGGWMGSEWWNEELNCSQQGIVLYANISKE